MNKKFFNNQKASAIILTILFSAFSFLFISCQAELEISQSDNSEVTLHFTGKSGPAFENMIIASTGLSPQETILFNTNEIRQALLNSGFTKIQINEMRGANLDVKFTDTTLQSFLFTSGLLSLNNKNELKLYLNPITLKSFYNNCNQEIQNLLDLLLSPVFNDEKMDESEYVETISSFYGEDTAKELEECELKITIIGKDKKKQLQKKKLSQLLCGM